MQHLFTKNDFCRTIDKVISGLMSFSHGEDLDFRNKLYYRGILPRQKKEKNKKLNRAIENTAKRRMLRMKTDKSNVEIYDSNREYDDIFDDLIKNPTVTLFRDERCFDFNFKCAILHRHNEIDELAGFFKSLIQRPCAISIKRIIVGPSGVGKTCFGMLWGE